MTPSERRPAPPGSAAGHLRAPFTIAVLSALALGTSATSWAQQTTPTPPTPSPDVVLNINSLLGVDDPASQIPPYVGSLYWGITNANTAVAPAGTDSVGLRFAESLINLSIILQDELPDIDLSKATTPDPRVDLDATNAPAFQLRTADDVPADFVLLHVVSGRADLVNLNIKSGRVDMNGDPVALTVIVDQDAVLGFRYADDFAFDENITGDGGVRIETDGIITFTGTNSYLGGTRVATGTLAGNDASLQGDFTLDPETRLDFVINDTTQTRFFAGNVDGEGRLIKSGLGRLFLLGGTASHTGGTEVALGTLQVTPDSLTGDVVISRVAQLEIEQSGSTPFDGAISGDGSVRKSGTAALRLGGANTFRGGLFVQEGDVIGTTGSIPGNVTLEAATPPAPTSRIVFDQNTSGTHTGTIAGTGVLRKQGTGRVLRRGVTTVDLVQIAAGTLAGDTLSLGTNIEVAAGGAAAEFAVGDTQAFVGTFSGAGDMWKTGLGTLILASDAIHTGETAVLSGVLQLDANLPGTSLVRVESGARLANSSGQIGGDLQNRGTVASGAPTTVFAIGGTASLEPGSVLESSLDDAGNASLLAVANTVTLDDPLYTLAITPGDYSTANTYTLLTSASGIVVSAPGQAVDDLAFIDVISGPNIVGSSVQLTVQENFSNLGGLGTTPNQMFTAIALEQVASSGTADSRTIRDGLVPLRTDQVPAVLDTLAGETLSVFTNARVDNARVFADALSRRLRTPGWELSRPPPRPRRRARPVSTAPPRSRGESGAWIEPFALFGEYQGGPNASDTSSDVYGFSGGFDHRLSSSLPWRHSENYRFGVGVGYSRYSVGNDTGFMSGSANGVQTALYGGYRGARFHAGGAARFAWTSMETDRRILFTSVDRNALGGFQGMEWGGLVEVGGHIGDRKQALFHPIARFQYIHTAQDGILETGAGDLSLSVPELDYDTYLVTAGARISRVFTLEGEFGLEPELHAAWTGNFGDLGRAVPATFYAVPGATPFVTAGTPPDANLYAVGIGYLMMVGDTPLLSTHYDYQFGETQSQHILSVGLYLRW